MEPPKSQEQQSALVKNSTSFNYPALDTSQPCARLVRFLPKDATGTLRFEMRNNALLDASDCEYFALSYEWGSSESRQTILIDESPLIIRNNLHSFLESLYRHHGAGSSKSYSEYLWADAICIDQTNSQERNHQVQQMKMIYSHAAEVVAWLGPSVDKRDGLVFDMLKDLHAQQTSWLSQTPETAEPTFWEPLWADSEIAEAFGALCRRTYWDRLWIVQELVLAKSARIMCGDYTAELEFFPMNMDRRFAYVNKQLVGIGCDRIMDYMFRRRVLSSDQSLLKVIIYFSDFGCTVDHDVVYGMLGIAQYPESILVNYEQPVASLFLNILYTLDEQESLDCIWSLSYALYLRYDALGSRLRVTSKANHEAGSPEESLDYLDTSSLSHVTFFRGEWVSFRGSDLLYDLTGRLKMLTSESKENECWCQCLLCNRRYQARNESCAVSFPLEHSSYVFQYRDNFQPPVIEDRTIPECFLVFSQQKKYLASFVMFSEHENSGICFLGFYDPFHECWEVENDIADSDGGIRREIRIPLLSVMILIMHSLQALEGPLQPILKHRAPDTEANISQRAPELD